MKVRTVNEMYEVSKKAGTPLLSNFNDTFWNDYIEHYTELDRYFARRYRSFRYFAQEESDTVEVVTQNFTSSVYEHLLVNKKRYEELYRVQSVNDNDYMLLDNYNVNETVTKEGSGNGSIVSGERTDTLSNTNKVSPFDSENFYNDTNSDNTSTKGSETDTTNNSYNETVTSNKKGNIGVQTGADMLGKHTNYWKNFDFYNLVFSEIAKELLLV